jgi:hypothetical protein
MTDLDHPDLDHPNLNHPEPTRPTDPQSALRAARQARLEAELAGCEMEELAAVLHRKPPVGRWPLLTRASFGPSVAVLSG